MRRGKQVMNERIGLKADIQLYTFTPLEDKQVNKFRFFIEWLIKFRGLFNTKDILVKE